MKAKSHRQEDQAPHTEPNVRLTNEQKAFAQVLGRILAELWDQERRGLKSDSSQKPIIGLD